MDTADTGTVSRPCADGCEVSVPSSAKRLAYKSCICKDVHPCVSSCEPSIATCDDNQINPLVPSSILFPSLTLDFKLLINSQNRNRYTLNPIKIKRCLPFFFWVFNPQPWFKCSWFLPHFHLKMSRGDRKWGDLWAKQWSHVSQRNGFSSVWVRRCCRKCPLKDRWQTGHWNGFMPPW